MPSPIFVWDPVKAVRNFRKHHVTFAQAVTVFDDPLLLLIPDLEHSEEEERWIALGRCDDQIILVVVHTELEPDTIRIISARPASQPERIEYEGA